MAGYEPPAPTPKPFCLGVQRWGVWYQGLDPFDTNGGWCTDGTGPIRFDTEAEAEAFASKQRKNPHAVYAAKLYGGSAKYRAT
jgi:hypothetical protein